MYVHMFVYMNVLYGLELMVVGGVLLLRHHVLVKAAKRQF